MIFNEKKINNKFSKYLFITGVVVHIGLAIGAIYIYSIYQLSPREFLVKVIKKTGVESPILRKVTTASPMFPDHQMDGQLKLNYPRILLNRSSSATSLYSILQKRKQSFSEQGIHVDDPCKTNSMAAQALCWALTADDRVAEKVLTSLKAFQPISPNEQTEYGDVWVMALSFDLLAGYSGFSDKDKIIIQQKLKKSLKEYIVLLDESGASLWHGRTTLASITWLLAVTLDPSDNKSANLIKQSQAHFLNVVAAAELTEAWPEGFNYWIQSRAFLFALAANAYINGVESGVNHNRIKRLLERIGLWHIYATRPDDRIEGIGDEGSRVDLKDEAQRVIDLIAQATGNPIFSQYSRYIYKLHKKQGYYKGYRWGQLLFSDPDVFSLPQADKSLSNFRSLPKVGVFGENAFNQFYIRSGWGDQDTFISFRAGHNFTHHGHADAGHFSIFKGMPLAINSSVYGKFTGENRLNYSIRSIAKNSLLILRPNEKVQPNKFFIENISDGGQRIVLPTGSTIDNTADWMSNLNQGRHYEAATLVNFEVKEDEFTYIKSDLTGAYNNTSFDSGGRGGKVEKVERSLVYLNKSDQLIIFDKVMSTDASYTKKWLLHTIDKPESENLTVLQGTPTNGILSTKSNYALIKNGKSYLHVQKLLPSDAELRLVGGTDYQYYVESDGDDSILNGRNMNQDSIDKPWFDVGMWRIEIQPEIKQKVDEFLVVMSPRLSKEKPTTALNVKLKGAHKGLLIGGQLILFIDAQSAMNLTIELSKPVRQILMLNLPSDKRVEIANESIKFHQMASTAGVAVFALARDFLHEDKVKISW